MGVEPQTQSSSGESESNSDSESENSDSCSYASSDSESDSSRSSHASKGSSKWKGAVESHKGSAKPKLQQQFSVTSSETGLRLKIAAIPSAQADATASSATGNNTRKASPKKKTPVATAAAKKGNFEKPVEEVEKPVRNHAKNQRESRSKVKTKKKSPLSESSSSSGHSYSDCSQSDSSSDSECDGKKHKSKSSPKRKSSSTRSSRAGPKLTATVYSKKGDTTDDGSADEKEQVSQVKVNSGDTASYTSANSNNNEVKSAKTVVKLGVNTRKKVTPKKKSKSAAVNPVAIPDKGKPAAKSPAKRPRGRPRTKTIQSNVSLITGDEETSCSSSAGGGGGCGGGAGGGGSSVRHSSPAASSSGESSSSDAESSSSSSSSSGSDSSAALAAACSLQVINEEDLAAILPEHQPYTAGFTDFGTDGQSQNQDVKTVQENGDGSSSEMELPPQLVNAAIQRATADSSSSENESTSQEMAHTSATHYASSLLQEFVAQTQLLSHTTPIAAVPGCVSNMTKVQNLGDCVLTQSCPVSEIDQMESNFLSSEHLSVPSSQQLSPQQTEELSQINRDLAEISSVTDSVEILIQNPPSLDDCVDNGDFMTLDITTPSATIAPRTVSNTDLETSDASLTVRSKTDFIAANLNESQNAESKNSFFDVKRKRGRPRKVKEEVQIAEQKIPLTCDNIVANPFCHDNDPPNVSPDSGILSNHNSPSHSPRRMESEDGLLKPVKSKFPAKLSPVPKRGSRSKSKSRVEPDKRDRSVSSEASVRRKNLTAVGSCKIESPSPIPKQEANKTERKKNENKLDIAALDRMLYATDRVLYPPRRKVGRPPQSKTAATKRGPGRPPKSKPTIDSGDSEEEVLASGGVLTEVYAKRKDINKLAAMPKKSGESLSSWRDNRSDQEGGGGDDPLDPTWREIDLNPKYKDILSGYKSDHEIKSYKSCSRLIESGYKSDYGFKSGYKSDHCCKSGYKTDHKSGYKSDKSGYKSDHSVRNMRRKMRKLKKSRSVRDRSYYKNQKYFVSEQEILLLANKTFSCLTLGHSTSDSDSECRSQGSYLPSKFRGAPAPATSSITFGLANRLTPLALPSITKVNLFAPAPVFSSSVSRLDSRLPNYSLFSANNRLGFNKTDRHSFGSLFTRQGFHMSAFTHKFACPPISTPRKDTFALSSSSALSSKAIPINNNTVKHPCRNASPKTKKSQKLCDNIYPVFKKEKSPIPIVDLFPQSQSSYIPNKSLGRNVFLNLKKPPKKSSTRWKKHKTQLVITPTKCHIPKSNGRLSRMSSRSCAESERHRRKSKKSKKRRRSRSASRVREACAKSTTSVVDQKFCQEMENLISHFMKLHAFPKPATQQSSKVSGDKMAPENAAKSIKRASKKRKGSDNTEVAAPLSKRRHKKQFQESQSKGGKEKDATANEHKLPLKKRHYHINPSANNSLNLSLVATEFVDSLKTENAKGSDPFLCTETDCPGDLKDDTSKDKPVTKVSIKANASTEKNKKDSNSKNQEHHFNSATESGKNNTHSNDGSVSLHIDVTGDTCGNLHISPASTGTDDEFSIKKPVGEHSELSKKIYEASEKLKAVNKMVHDLEKSLPKTKESEIGCKDSKVEASKVPSSKTETKNTNTSSTGSTGNATGAKHSPPVVTPKKRHRLEVDKLTNTGLDLVVQSLSKKLSDDKVLHLDKNTTSTEKVASGRHVDSNSSKSQDDHTHSHRHSSSSDSKKDDKDSGSQSDTVKSGSSRTMSKNLLPPTQKSEIITRKKNRLEGLTSNLVSKINPSSATKVLDTLMSNNLRKSIESRILERSKTGSNDPHEKSLEGSRLYKDGFTAISTRATVIKSPISKSKLPAEAKKLPKGTDILIEETVVYNYDKPTGIFEPSVDIELQIPKSSISVNHVISESSPKSMSKAFGKSADSKNNGKVTRISLEGENQIPMVSLPVHDKTKKVESIASVISDKIQESGHNLRHSKRNHSNDSEEKSDGAVTQSTDKKKKKSVTNLLKESKLKLVSKPLQNKIHQERVSSELPKSEFVKSSEIENIAVKNAENIPLSRLSESSIPLKKRAKRRKTINRTGFPSIKKKKKKFNPPTSAEGEITNENNPALSATLVPLVSDLVSKNASAFDRVPKIGEATTTFVERTTRKKHGELKVILNKDECPKQGRVSVIALERLQGKTAVDNNNISIIKPGTLTSSAQTIVTAVSIDVPDISISTKTPLSINTEPAMLDSVAKWEILSETDSLPPLSSGSIGNDPEDSIPLSLLNFKSERPNSGLEQRTDRSKRKLRDVSPCDSIENVSLSKRAIIEKGLKAKTVAVAIGDNVLMKRLTRRNDTPTSVDTDDAPLITTVNKNKQNSKYAGLLKQSRLENISNGAENVDNNVSQDSSGVSKIVQRRKSRSCNIVKRLRDMSPSSRDSSLETVKTFKKSPKSRDVSVETIKHLSDNCLENDPLPLQEKEIDFEKSIDVLSKSIINKKRIMSSRDDSPASSVERGYRSERDKGSTKRNPKIKKKYLVAGLFSDYYKVNDPKPVDPKSKLVYKASDHPNGLIPPPPYCERWVRQRKIHFTLPYDIWWQHQYNQPVPSWNYRKIRTNVYYDVKPTPDGCESQACSCPPSSECQDDCINRMVYAECSPQLCPCKDLCKNQRIQRHEIAPGLDKFMTENKGWGVRTKMPITNGTFILEYVGEVVSDKEFKDRMASRYVKDTHHYCLHLDGGLVIDGHRMGGEGRFVNHSCQPNCEMQKWSVNGLFRMALFALRDIKSGEELTYDYNFSLFNPAEGQACKCDSENCRGVIGGKSQRITKPVVKNQSKTSTLTGVAVGTSTTPPVVTANPSQANPPTLTPNRVGRPRKAIKTNMKPNGQSNVIVNVNSPERNDALSFMKEVQNSRFWQEPQMKALTNKEKLMVKDRHCFLHRNLDKVRRIRERMLSHASHQLLSNMQPGASQISGMPNSVAVLPSQTGSAHPGLLQHNICNPSVFLTRLHALRAPRNIRTRRLARAEDNPELSKHARLANVFRELYNVVVNAKDDKGELLCAPLLRRKASRNAETDSSPLDLSTIQGNIETGHYKNIALFDSHFNSLFTTIIKTLGRTSSQGIISQQLRKVYNNVKLDFADQLTTILGPEEPLPQGFLQKRKQEEVILCVCGLHGEEGLMVQCGGEGDQNQNITNSSSISSNPKISDVENSSIKNNPKPLPLPEGCSSEPENATSDTEKNAVKGCGVWQHARCMAVVDTGEPYYCHRCQPREVNLEISLDEYTDEGHQFYLSLLRGDLQVRQGDTVYVLRDIPVDDQHPDCSSSQAKTQITNAKEGPNVAITNGGKQFNKRIERSKKGKNTMSDKDKGSKDKNSSGKSGDVDTNDNSPEVRKHTYKTIGAISVSELDIFRVERLWKDSATGQRYVYGHHYLRPHETYHEPTRKFFPNEVMRVPLYEAVPIELVMSQCWVMDLNTFCKGRPLTAKEEHVYICELRVDKCARLFTKISRPKYPVCTKSYAFEMFPQRLKITRTYAPHEVSPSLLKNRSRKPQENNGKSSQEKQSTNVTHQHPALPAPKPKGAPLLHAPIVKTRATQKCRLNNILLKLLSKMPTKQPLDMSYLLDGRRQRKKMISS